MEVDPIKPRVGAKRKLDFGDVVTLGRKAFNMPIGVKVRRRTYIRRRSVGVRKSFNQGFTIHNQKAVNVKKRRRRYRNRRYKRIKKLRSLANVSGRLMAKLTRRHILLTEMEVERGAVLLPNVLWTDANTSLNAQWCPLQLIEINRVENGAANIHYQLYHNNTTPFGTASVPQYAFTRQIPVKVSRDGETVTAPNDYNMLTTVPDSLVNTSGASADKTKWYHDYTTVDLMMYGQKDVDTMYRIDVVQFDPFIANALELEGQAQYDYFKHATPPISVTGHQYSAAEWKSFWFNLVAPYTMNPMTKKLPVRKLMRVLKTYKFKIPEQSADYDRINCVKTRIKIPVNKTVSRYWGSSAGVPLDSNADPENVSAINNESFKAVYGGGYAHPKYRTFLMIRATNPDQRQLEDTNIITVGKGVDPTYDIRLTSHFTFNE